MDGGLPMNRLNASLAPAASRPVKVLQYGEGNFLRAFVDYMVDIANEKTDFNGSIVLVKPIEFGNLNRFHEQDCRYTVLLRGLENGEKTEKTCIIERHTVTDDRGRMAGRFLKIRDNTLEQQLLQLMQRECLICIVPDAFLPTSLHL